MSSQAVKLFSTLLRIFWIIILEFYSMVLYCILLVLLQPLRLLSPRTFWWIVGYLSYWTYAMSATCLKIAGYTVAEAGDDVMETCINDRSLVLVNHLSSMDIVLIMYVMSHRYKMSANLMWVIVRKFLYTHFGIACWLHGDFYIEVGKENRQRSLMAFERHLKDVYIPLQRKWILLFPEGRRLFKHREVSQRFAENKGLPVLNHVALPKTGAAHCIINTLQDSPDPGDKLKWVIDVTIAYPGGIKPLYARDVLFADRPPFQVVFHYRKYPIEEVPRDQEQLTQWLYQRYTEKEQLLETYYTTGKFTEDISDGSVHGANEYRPLPWNWFWVTCVHIGHIFVLLGIFKFFSLVISSGIVIV